MGKKPDLTKLSLSELTELRKDVDRQINDFEKRKRADAMKALQAVAKEHGLSIDEILGNKASKGKAALPPKFRNPENPDQTWSGRGRQPAWYKAAMESGTSPESLQA